MKSPTAFAAYAKENPALAGIVPIAINVSMVCRLLTCGPTHVYDLINKGELESFNDGKSRRVILRSVEAYIQRQLAAAKASNNEAIANMPPRRPRGRPRKDTSAGTAPRV